MRADLVPVSTCELLPTISNEIVPNSTFADYMFEKHPLAFRRVDNCSAGELGRDRSRSVDYYQDSCVHGNSLLGKVCNEVYRYTLPWMQRWL